jgi:hypothetical protein
LHGPSDQIDTPRMTRSPPLIPVLADQLLVLCPAGCPTASCHCHGWRSAAGGQTGGARFLLLKESPLCCKELRKALLRQPIGKGATRLQSGSCSAPLFHDAQKGEESGIADVQQMEPRLPTSIHTRKSSALLHTFKPLAIQNPLLQFKKISSSLSRSPQPSDTILRCS